MKGEEKQRGGWKGKGKWESEGGEDTDEGTGTLFCPYLALFFFFCSVFQFFNFCFLSSSTSVDRERSSAVATASATAASTAADMACAAATAAATEAQRGKSLRTGRRRLAHQIVIILCCLFTLIQVINNKQQSTSGSRT